MNRASAVAIEPWLTKRELARRLRCSTRTIERLDLPAMRVGGQNRYQAERGGGLSYAASAVGRS